MNGMYRLAVSIDDVEALIPKLCRQDAIQFIRFRNIPTYSIHTILVCDESQPKAPKFSDHCIELLFLRLVGLEIPVIDTV